MDAAAALLATLVAYQLLLLGVGAWAVRRNRDQADFFLGGRKLGPWVASLSAAASSSSAWTLLGVSGAAYLHGLGALWLFPSCLGGFALNWFLVAGRLRQASAARQAVTLTEFLAAGTPRQRVLFAGSAATVTLVSLGVYVASQFEAAGKAFGQSLGMEPHAAILVGAGVVLLYTMTGGFWAVSVTDLVQGLVMAVAAVALPVAALIAVGGLGPMLEGLRAVDPVLLDPWQGKSGMAALGLVAGFFGIGLGYPGQPHVVNRFMAMRESREIRQGAAISLTWAVLIYGGMLITGWCGRVLLDGLGDHEGVLLALATRLLPPAAAGVIVAAVLSAIMSTADSQLLVCGSAVAYDLGGRQSGRQLARSRLTVLAIGVLATGAALLVDETIFRSVLFAWSALGAAFGPLLLVRLWLGPVRPALALAALWTGFSIAVLVSFLPAFAAATLLAVIGRFRGQTSDSGPDDSLRSSRSMRTSVQRAASGAVPRIRSMRRPQPRAKAPWR